MTTLTRCPICASVLTTTNIGGRDRLVCLPCEFVHWDNPKPVTATLIPIVDEQFNKLVLVRRKFPPFVDDWCLPGGFIEALESPEESAIREVEEETGLLIEIDRLIGAYTPGKTINVIILFYLAKKLSKATEKLLKAGDDASEVACFSQSTLPTNIAFELHGQMIYDWFKHQFRV